MAKLFLNQSAFLNNADTLKEVKENGFENISDYILNKKEKHEKHEKEKKK